MVKFKVDVFNARQIQLAINHYKVLLRLVDKIKDRNIVNFSTVADQWLKYQKIRENDEVTSTVFHLLLTKKLECEDLENQIRELYK